MNQSQPYMDASQGHAAPPAPAPGMAQYPNYAQPQSLQPASHGYAPPTYAGYPYTSSMAPIPAGHPVTAPMGGQMVPQSLPLPTMANGQQPPPPAQQAQQYQHHADTTGQVAPHGMKPRVTATLWEDEGSLCFQVEANGVCVARREDNHMINGTKLLNVAGMTRGRRDGILKSEKTRHVVKIGPMHLKGVWIPFDRALDFANKEKITEMLYPLFVHNIGSLLYHPTNQARQSISSAAAAMAARRPDQPGQQPQGQQPGSQQPQQSQEYMRTPQAAPAPALTHHHSMTTPVSNINQQMSHPIAPHVGSTSNSYEYASSAPHGGNMSSASTPPTNTQPMPYSTQSYDNSRQMYTAPASYAQPYASQQAMNRYGSVQASPSAVKNEMAPPVRSGTDNEHVEGKQQDGYHTHHEPEGDHESDYTHTRISEPARHSYAGGIDRAAGPVHSDPSHISPDMTHSPHQNGSGRATPRTTTAYPGYSTPQRSAQLPQSNLNYVMSNDTRPSAPNGSESYPPSGYPYPPMNGAPPPAPSNKRGREMDEQEDPYSRQLGGDLKRQRADMGGAVRPISQPQSVKAGGMRR